MVAQLTTFAFHGVEARPVTAQVQISGGTFSFAIVGLPDKAVSEARERVRAAMEKAGVDAAEAPAPEWKGVNLADASPEELEGVLSDTVLGEFKMRLGRIGIEYQTPDRP